MDSSKSSMVIPFKSKKSSLTTTPIKKENNQVFLGPAVSTPEKAILNPVNRIRNKNFALSISDIRRSALQLQKSNLTGSDSQNVVSKKSFNNVIGQKSKGSDKSANVLPEKYEMLCDFFVAMVNSIRLLRLKSVPGSFTKLAHKIESLTDRRFTLRHLAQLKYIVPEVIVAKKILVQDEKTKCMEEELLVSLDMGAVENDTNAKGGDGFAKLKKMFRSRITDYSKTHLEVDDIPEGELPHLFKQPKKEVEPIMNTIPTPMAASLTSPSFKRRFSSRSLRDPVVESMPAKPSSCLSEIPNKEVTCADDTDGPSCSTVEADATPLNPVSTPAKLASIPTKLASTPAELASTPARLMAATPELRTRKRPPMTPDHDSNDFTTSLKRSKSLKFDDSSVDNEDHLSQVDEEESIAPAQDSTITKDDVLEILPDGLLQSLIEKERKMIEEKDPVVVNAKRRQQMMTRVPRLFDMIRLLFQSIRRSVISKEELIYKLLAGNFEIVDRTEVEEQLQLLQEVAPEFISEKQSISGDTLLSLNKCSSPDSIRAKLLEAK